MSNSTMKASGKLEKGIIATPGESFLKGVKQPSSLKQKYAPLGNSDTQEFQKAEARTGLNKVDSYDYGFDKMPI